MLEEEEDAEEMGGLVCSLYSRIIYTQNMCVYTAHTGESITMIWLLDINKIKCFACKWSENLQRIQRTPHQWKTHFLYHIIKIVFRSNANIEYATFDLHLTFSRIGIRKMGNSLRSHPMEVQKQFSHRPLELVYRFKMKLFWFMISKKKEIDSNVGRGEKLTSTNLFWEKLTVART